MLGPAAIITAAGVGAGELLTGPVAIIRYGPYLMWITVLGVLFQTILNAEAARYTVVTGETIWQGFARLFPGPKFWGPVWIILFFIQNFWPGWAAATATGIAFLYLGRVPGAADKGVVITIGIILFLLTAALLLFSLGGRIERLMEVISFGEIVFTLIVFVVALMVAPPNLLLDLIKGSVAFGAIPEGVDWVLISAFAGYVGSSGTVALLASNYYRDRGYGMGAKMGYIPGLVGGKPMRIAEVGYYPKLDEENKKRFRGWMMLVNLDQSVIFGVMNYIGMLAPVALAAAIVPRGTKISEWGVVGQIASYGAKIAPWMPILIVLIWCWLLWTTQLSSVERIPRFLTDITLSIGPEKLKKIEDVRKLYYPYLLIFSVLAIIAMTQVQPFYLVIAGAVVSSFNFFLGGLLVCLVNMRLLPKDYRPSLWRLIILAIGIVFYGYLSYQVFLRQVLGLR